MLTPDHDDGADLLDVDGRPVGEVGSVHYTEVETELGGCPYDDARKGRPMNRSALRQLSVVWPEVRATVAAMAARASRPATVAGAWQTALAGTAIPSRWAREHPGVAVPRLWSAIYKTSLGFSQVLTALLLSAEGVADCVLSSLGTPEAFLDLLDREEWLVGEQQVCAGPPAWIGALLQALSTPDPSMALPFDVGTLGRRRATWVALQVVFLGEARNFGPQAPRLPCLRAAQALPGRQATHARRLFGDADVPDAVERFLEQLAAEPDASLARLGLLRDEAIRTVADA